MLPPMGLPKPLAGWSVVAAFALIGLAVLATAWSTRSSVASAASEVASSEVRAIRGDIQKDFSELGDRPTSQDLAEMVDEHASQGLRYIAIIDASGRVEAEAGKAIAPLDTSPPDKRVEIEELGGRIRVELRGRGRNPRRVRDWWTVFELEPVRAKQLRADASRTFLLGSIGALTLLGVAIVVVRRELRRQADEKRRERELRLQSLGEMSAVLAHEIKNPLASLKGNAQLLASMLPQGEKTRGKAERVVDEAVRLEKLTNDLLAFVRTGELKRTSADVGALVRDVASCHGDAVSVDVPPGITWVIDADRMRQVVANLIENGLQAGPPVRVTARAGSQLVIEIADKGPGVPADDRERIFEPFFTKKTQGTGLGLALCRRVVELHGGSVTVSDDPSGGAVFRIAIPRES
jgi:two-component system, NtrC family, sensor histidine kinase HydH